MTTWRSGVICIMIGALVVTGCGNSTHFTDTDANPDYVVIVQYETPESTPTTKIIQDTQTANELVEEINAAGIHVVIRQPGQATSCPAAIHTGTYDIILHYKDVERTFTYSEAGCTFLYDALDKITLYGDLPTIDTVFKG